MSLNHAYMPAIGLGITQIMGYGTRLGWNASASMAVMALCVAVAFLAYLRIEDPRRTPAHDPT